MCSAIDAYRLLGPARFARVAPLWLVRPLYVAYAVEDREPLASLPIVEGLHWTQLEPNNLAPVLGLMPTLSATEARRRLAEGQVCWIAWNGDEPLHCRWEATTPVWLPYLRRQFQPLPGDVLVMDTATAPAARGQRLLTSASAHAANRYLVVGLTRIVAFVAYWNTPAIRACERARMHRVGAAGIWRLGPWYRPFTRGAVQTTATGAVFIDRQGAATASRAATAESPTRPATPL